MKFNVLNAQETITIGSGDETHARVPSNVRSEYSYNQQIYTKDELNIEAGVKITNISLRIAGADNVTRKWKVYMLNLEDKSSFSNPTDWVSVTESDVFYKGDVSINGDNGAWIDINSEGGFVYSGNNLLLCIQDYTGTAHGDFIYFYTYNSDDNSCIRKTNWSELTPDNIVDAGNATYDGVMNQIRLTYESSAPAVMPSSVPEIISATSTHNSITLTWTEVENAKKYNVYTNTEELVATVSATSYTIKNLDANTGYCYKVSAVNGEYETDPSEVYCRITLEAPETRNIVFKLTDSYGDGWNGGRLTITYHGNETETMTISNGYEYEQTIEIECNTEVHVVYTPGSYAYENSFTVSYDDGTVIYSGDQYNNTDKTFTVEPLAPEVTVAASAYDIYSDQTATLTATAANFDGDVEYSWSPAENLSDASISDPVFTPSATGSFEFTCTATDANNNEASASLTINVTERPALALDVTADKTEIYQGQYTMLDANATGGFHPYTYKWFLNGEENGMGESFYFYQTEVGEYTITCKVTDANGGTIEKSVTVNVLANPFAGKQFRVKVMEGSYAGSYLDVYNDNGTIGVESKTERNTQIFAIEKIGENQYYLKTADGYYIKCETGTSWWNVHAYNTYDKTPLEFEYTNEEQFYIKDYDKMTGNSQTDSNDPNNCYFKVENAKVYCDAPIDKNVSESHRTVLWSLEEVLPSPENLAIVEGEKTQLYPGETTEISWGALDGAAGYNVYVNDVKFNTEAVEGLSYELVNLPYGMNTIAVAAVFENGSESGMSNTVTVQMAGTFPLTIKVQDMNGNAVANASLTIDGTDEYQVYRTFEGTTDDVNGEWYKADMPLLYEYYSYNIKVSAEPFKDGYSFFNESDTENGVAFTKTIEMELPIIYPQTEKQSYDAKEDIVLMWDAVDSEYLQGYNVYVNDEEDPRNTEGLLESAIYTLEGGLDETGSVYVTAVYEGYGESGEGYGAYVNINAYGTISGTVIDGTNPIAGAEVVAKGIDNITWMESEYTVITDNNGQYELSVLPNYPDDYYAYSISVSKYGYESYTSTTKYNVVGGETTTIEPIVLTANADVTFAVTATEGEGNVTVTWEAPEGATQYNVFRKDATEAVVKLTETPITEQEYLATDWNELSNGTYQYGVSAFVGGGSETLYTDDFSSDKGWSGQGNWTMSNGMYSFSMDSGGLSRYRLSPTFTIGENAAIVKFDYVNTGANTLTVYLECAFSITLGTIPAGTEGTFISDPIDREHFGIDLLNTNAQINFTCTSGGSSTTTVDNLVVYSESAPVESSINWATALTKNDANVFTSTGEWTSADNWSNGVPAEGANVFIEGNVTIASNVNVNNMTINGGSVTINNGASLTVEGTLVNEAAAKLVINDGAQIFQNNEDVPATFVMGITKPKEWQSDNKDGWQFISSPFTNASVFNFTNGNYDLFKYDGEEDLEWQNHKANAASFGSTFEQGVGYLASHQTESTIELTGTLNAKNSYSWDYLYYNEEKPLANFHLLGNPFTFNMDITKAAFTNLVEGVAVVTSDGGYDYSQTTIPVGDAFFVKANGDYYYSSLSYGSRGARSTRSNSLNITATGNAGKDNVVINFAGKSEGFDKLQNFNDAIATVYVAEDGKNYGIYNCDADVQEVELNFNANKMGNYTISIEPDGEFETVTLVDRFTGVETNMLEGEYTFTAMSSDNHNRFVLRMVNGQQTTDNSHFVYQSGEELILNIQGEVQIVDVLGRVVYNGEAMNDINRINVSSFNSGAYMVKVMNGNEVKVEKVVIY